jgi:hypothetical protein
MFLRYTLFLFNAMNEEKTYDKLVCESCRKEFSCGAKAEKCWCFEVELKSKTLKDLQKDFKNCLCRDCLIKQRGIL